MASYVLGTPLPSPIHDEAERVIVLLRSGAPRSEKVDALDDLIFKIVRVGLDYHFRGPAEDLGLSPLLLRVVDVAAGTTLKALKAAARRVLLGLSDEQLEGLSEELEARIYPVEEVEE